MRTIKLEEPLEVNFTPKDLKFPKYMLPNTLGNSEAEEVIACYITICQTDNKWAGFYLSDFVESLVNDFNNIDEISKKIYTLITLDRFKKNDPTFAEIGLSYLLNFKYITFKNEGDDTCIFPTKKLLRDIEKYVFK